MKAAETTLAWTASNATPEMKGWKTAGQVGVGPRPPHSFVDPYGGWVYPDQGMGGSKADADVDFKAIAMLFVNFHTMVVRDGIDPKVAHEAMLAIDEYRQRISPDIIGAD